MLILLVGACAAEDGVKPTQISGANTERGEGNGTDMRQNQGFFLKQIFNKYGDHGVITFEVKNLSDVHTGSSCLTFIEMLLKQRH